METGYTFINNLVKPNFNFVHIVSVIPAYIYDISFNLLYILNLSGNVEENPGPRSIRRWQWRIFYANIRGLHANLSDIIAASGLYDILICSETLVSGMSMPQKYPFRVLRNQCHP